MNTFRDVVLALVSSLVLVQFLPRAEPAGIPGIEPRQAVEPAVAKPAAPGVPAAPTEQVAIVQTGEMVQIQGQVVVDNGDEPSVQNGMQQESGGSKAEVLVNGRWVTVEVLQTEGERCRVRFSNRPRLFSQWISQDELRYTDRDEDLESPRDAEAWVENHWCRCTVTKRNGDAFYFVEYHGLAQGVSEWLSSRKVRFMSEDGPRSAAASRGMRKAG